MVSALRDSLGVVHDTEWTAQRLQRGACVEQRRCMGRGAATGERLMRLMQVLNVCAQPWVAVVARAAVRECQQA